MIILAAVAGVAASTLIYSVENVIDRKVTTKIQERRSSQLAAQQQQDVVAEAAPPAQVYVPTPQVTDSAAMEQAPAPVQSAREAALEAQLLQMQQAFAQLQAVQAQTAATTPTPVDEEPLVKKGQVVAICDTATPAEGDLDTILPSDKRQGRVVKVNGDGTVKVNVSLGGKAGAKSVTVSEYDVIPV